MKKPARITAAALNRPAERLEGLNTYTTGKMKRYSLLFAVNGGAFAIAKLLGESETNVAVWRSFLAGVGGRLHIVHGTDVARHLCLW